MNPDIPVKWVSRASIVIEDRQRRQVSQKKLDELVKSIETVGLLHPVILRSSGTTYRLVAGERRLRAIQLLQKDYNFGPHLVPWDQVPALVIGENITEYEAALIELEENLRREDLSWQDEARALARLVTLKGSAAEASVVLAKAQDIAPVTARNKIAKAMRVAPLLDDPDVASAQSLRQADAKVRLRQASEAPFSFDLVCGDATVHILDEPDNHYDIIFLDPPYGIGANDWRGMPNHPYDDKRDTTLALMKQIAPELMRVAREGAHLWCFCDIDSFTFFRQTLASVGFRVLRTPVVWNKLSVQGSTPMVDVRIRRNYELLLFALKNPPRDVNRLTPDVINVPHTQFPPHGAAKSPEIYSHLLELSATPTSRILDPFAGTAPSLEAARRAGLAARGFEISQEVCELARKRWAISVETTKTPALAKEGLELAGEFGIWEEESS